MYRAYHVELGQPVALKFLSGFRGDSRARARLRTEVRLARQISHPHVCRGTTSVKQTTSCTCRWSSSTARISRRCSNAWAACPRLTQSRSPQGFAPVSPPRMRKACCIATSSRATSCSTPRGQVRIMDFGLAASAAQQLDAAISAAGPLPTWRQSNWTVAQRRLAATSTLSASCSSSSLPAGSLSTAAAPPTSSPAIHPAVYRSLDACPGLPPAIDRTILRCLEPDPPMRPGSALEVEGLLAMKQGKQFYEFGPFRIEEHERLLRRGQEVVALPPKAAELLLALVERQGEAVRKRRNSSTSYGEARSPRKPAWRKTSMCCARPSVTTGVLTTSIPFHGEATGSSRRSGPSARITAVHARSPFSRSPIFQGMVHTISLRRV